MVMKNYEVYVQNWAGGELEHDYNLQVLENNTARVTRSHSDSWTEECRGECIGTIYDDGNEVRIELLDREPITLDYAESSALHLLLLANQEKEFKTEIRISEPVISFTGLS